MRVSWYGLIRVNIRVTTTLLLTLILELTSFSEALIKSEVFVSDLSPALIPLA